MRKIKTLFVRDPADRAHVTRDVTLGCEWVIEGEGIATRKWDGTCVLIDAAGFIWARREVKPGKTPPSGWWEADNDPVTGKRVGWEPTGQSSFAKVMRVLIDSGHAADLQSGTYELVGPKINGNPDEFDSHRLVPHGQETLALEDRTFDGIRAFLRRFDHYEGIVFWREQGNPDAGMVKIKAKDFPV